MKVMLYSHFYIMPNSDVIKALNAKTNKCLFCSYADESAVDYNQRNKSKLKEIFDEVISLTPNTNLETNFDCVFINGGNVFELIYRLKKYNQFDKIKQIIENGALYIGNSAGSEICTKDCVFISEFEPPKTTMDIKKYCEGFGFIDKKILVEASRLTISQTRGLAKETNYHNYLVYKLKQKNAIKVPNNAVVIIDNKQIKTKKYEWKKLLELKQKRDKNVN